MVSTCMYTCVQAHSSSTQHWVICLGAHRLTIQIQMVTYLWLVCDSHLFFRGQQTLFFLSTSCMTYGFERNWKTYQCYMQKLLCVVLKNVLLFPKHISKSLKNDLNLHSSSSPLVLEYCITVSANLIAHASCHPLCWFRLHGLSALSSYLFL